LNYHSDLVDRLKDNSPHSEYIPNNENFTN
jgi:hypothetical protein